MNVVVPVTITNNNQSLFVYLLDITFAAYTGTIALPNLKIEVFIIDLVFLGPPNPTIIVTITDRATGNSTDLSNELNAAHFNYFPPLFTSFHRLAVDIFVTTGDPSFSGVPASVIIKQIKKYR